MPPRVILYTGKGGVGKTSVAAAAARRCAGLGHRTLILSTDPAHSLADAVEQPLGPEPTAIEDGLWGQEVVAETEMRRHWDLIGSWVSGLLSRQGVDRVRAEELTVPPGMDELFSLLQIKHHFERDEFDVIVVDCAPSGETLRLLGYPEVAGWWLRRLFPRNRALLAAASPLARALDVPVPEPELAEEFERLLENLLVMDRILRDRDHCSIRLVMTPDRMVIDEARRTFTHLSLFGYATDAVVVNRLFPEAVEGTYFESWRHHQEDRVAAVHEGFAPVPVLTAPFFDREVVGAGMQESLADELHGDDDPARILNPGPNREITSRDGFTVIRIPVPFVSKDEIRLQQSGDELLVSAGDLRRSVILPSGLARRSPERAGFEDGVLEISFKEESATATEPATAAEQ